MAGEVAAGLANLSKNFSVQEQRLSQVLQLASALTGVQADDVGDPDAAPGSGMLVDRFDPFAAGAKPDSGLVADPFAATSEHSIFDPDAAQSSDFARTVVPGEDDQPVDPPTPVADVAPTPDPDLVTASDLLMDEAPAAPAPSLLEPDLEAAGDPAPPVSADSPLPLEGEKVYDLSEFDALPLHDGQPAADSADERIYDLSDFGAVKIE